MNDTTPVQESEPDYRMSLAAERTYLAYVRTALGLLAGGVAVASVLPDTGSTRLREAIGVILVLTGLLVAVNARRRWREVTTAMRRGDPLPSSRAALAISVGVVAAAVLALVLVMGTGR